MEHTPLKVSDCIALINQTLEYAYPVVLVEGEVSSFKVNQGKYVFFDLKDETGTLNCFMTVYQLRTPLEDGMKVRVVAAPKLTQWGRFSLTVRDVQPVGEGSLKRSFELLRAKLEKEGLFAPERKRRLPVMPHRIGVVSSTQAAGYADFINILNARWGGLEVIVAHTLVQGISAPRQIVKAIEHFNQMAEPPEVIALIRGGGSADDLAAFNDEPLVRAIASSRVPIIVGVGHETDTSLADLVADVSAVTPTNAAQLLVPDQKDIERAVNDDVRQMLLLMQRHILAVRQHTDEVLGMSLRRIVRSYEYQVGRVSELSAVLRQLNPRAALNRGYAIVKNAQGLVIGSRAAPSIGETLSIETNKYFIEAGVTNVTKRN
ncbi:exodeoxyribonuclease VII large subunit [Pedobacter sp.]|nr:exodeoxyribonuclease VII large subunit [Candidatus Saccharibacteria bacterium]